MTLGMFRVLVVVGILALAVGCQKKAAQTTQNAAGSKTAAVPSETRSEAGVGGAPSRDATRSMENEPRRGKAGTLTEDEDGAHLDLKVGQIVTVVLDSNHATGLSWGLGNPIGNVMVQDGKALYAVRKGSPEPGGLETWRFRAARKGEQTVRLEYRRQWNQSVPERTFRFVATVR